MTASPRRDKQLFRWDLRRCAGSGGYAIALITSLAVTTAASPAAAAYWYGGGHKHHTAHKSHEAKAADHIDREPFGQIQKGPLQIFISINQQKLHLYSDGVHVADTSIATGVPGLPTPLGVFSVIQKQVFHRSNIYSGAPMPYMQRITWSGVAMHEGESIGHRASHGCIRMPHDFAVRLYRLTKLNTRVIIANSELKPTEFADPHLFVHKEIPPEVASPVDPVDNGVEPVVAKSAELAAHANTLTLLVQSDVVTPQAAPPAIKPDQSTESAAPGADAGASGVAAPPTSPTPTELAKAAAAKQTPISIFISRKRQRLYIRQDVAPLFDSAVTIAQPDAPLGTHVFTALEFTGPEHTILRWNVVSLPGEPPRHVRYVEERRGRHGRVIEEERASDTPPPQGPAQVFARIEISPEVRDAIAQMIIPGTLLIISDQGLGDETGEGTDFIVVAR
ncbi:MAG TPA: L,D-transpeptidase family protein [Xanthobacteraceae bacterium]|nr:L,D-transpeptidase family protein [Xanthobacteraceae bacterium]